MKGPYDDIINLPHHVSSTRPQMPASDRAAQFSPFAALTGYDAAVRETARLTDEKIELDEDEKAVLDEKLQLIAAHMSCNGAGLEISVTYFQPDEKKAGGAYVTAAGTVKKVDLYTLRLIMQDGREISFEDILKLELL